MLGSILGILYGWVHVSSFVKSRDRQALDSVLQCPQKNDPRHMSEWGTLPPLACTNSIDTFTALEKACVEWKRRNLDWEKKKEAPGNCIDHFPGTTASITMTLSIDHFRIMLLSIRDVGGQSFSRKRFQCNNSRRTEIWHYFYSESVGSSFKSDDVPN